MFEFDPAKSEANRDKHGIDFNAAQALWEDEERTEIPTRFGTPNEDRWIVIGMIADRMWTAIVTYRGEATRMISVRRARKAEERLMATAKTISAEEFDRRFDDGEDVTEFLELSRLRRPGLEARRVNVDFPNWMVQSLDVQAKRRGVTRQALIKMWLADRLEVTG